jgi:hypothetical protein
MSFTFSSFQALLLPLIIVFGIMGLRKGFWREVGITAGMAIVVLFTVIRPDLFIGYINRIIINIPRVIGLLLGTDAQALPADLVFGDPSSGRYLLARIALFVLLTFLVYTARFAWAYPDGRPRAPRTSGERVLGAIFGGITGFLWFVALINFLDTIRDLRNNPTIPPEGTTVTVPTVTDLGPLLAFVPTLVVILIIILLVLAALRLPRIWTDGGGGGGGRR